MFESESADLEIHLPDVDRTGSDPTTRVVEALRALRLVGFVETADGWGGWVDATVAVAAGRGLVVADSEGGVATLPLQPMIDTISARLNADVVLTWGDETYSATPPDFRESDHTDSADAPHIYVVAGELSLAPNRRSEFAIDLGSSFTAIPCGDRAVVVADSRSAVVPWPANRRPVITLQRTARELWVETYTASAVRAVKGTRRFAQIALADWIGVWSPAPHLIQTQHDTDDGPAHDTERSLLRARESTLRDVEGITPEAATELGIDVRALSVLLAQPLTEGTDEAVVAAMHIPWSARKTVLALLRGEDGAAMPGAIRVENRGVSGAIADAVLGEPEGTSLWARWRALPHRHPRLTVVLIAAELILAGAVLASAIYAPLPQPWLTVQWIIGGVMAVDAVGDALMLRVVRRRSQPM